MGRFESYPATDTLNDDDITLYNHSNATNKVTFSNLVTLIKNKLESMGLISIGTGIGLSGGTITSSGVIKCNLKSETPSTYNSIISTMLNRQYAVGVDSEGYLSVNVPWEINSYQSGSGITLVNNTIGVDYTNVMKVDGSNAASEVTFSGAFTVGNRAAGSDIGSNSVAEGSNVTASGNVSHAEGNNNSSEGAGSHSEGWSDTLTINIGNRSSSAPTELDTTVNPISAMGAGSHAEGYVKKSGRSNYENIIGAIQASGDGAHAEGYSDSTNAIYGYAIIASGDGAHAEGYAKSYDVVASGIGSHAEGTGTRAIGSYSHAEGDRTTATASCSHVEGRQCKTVSLSEGGHAEGSSTEAGYWSHSEGGNTKAYGSWSHTEGNGTYVSGDCGHAEGNSSKAYGAASHAGGIGGIAHRDGQFVQGGGFEGNKFPNNTFSAYGQGKAYFGFQPSLTETYGDITNGKCGCGGTITGTDRTARISLEPLGMYVLYCSAFESNGAVYGACVYMITASGNYWQIGYQNFTSDPPTILLINQTSNDVAQITAVAHNVLSIQGTRAYTQFHLIRIM